MEINNQYDFFKNILLDTDGALVVSGSDAIGTTNSLSDVLSVGNETNANDILLTNGDAIRNASNSNNAVLVDSDLVYVNAGLDNSYSEVALAYETLTLTSTDGTSTSTVELDPLGNANGNRLYTTDGTSFGYVQWDYAQSYFENSDGGLNSGYISLGNQQVALGVSDSVNASTQTIESTQIIIDTIALLLPNIPTYANNAAAVADSYPTDGVYKTSTGELRIVV